MDPALRQLAALIFGAVLVLPAAGCARHHLRGEALGDARPLRLDAGATDTAPLPVDRDAGPDRDARAAPPPDARCTPTGVLLSFRGDECDAAAEARCDDWAQSQARFGTFAHAVCVNVGGHTLSCATGDYCPGDAGCRCTPSEICALGRVCMSDTPDGPTYCGRGCR